MKLEELWDREWRSLTADGTVTPNIMLHQEDEETTFSSRNELWLTNTGSLQLKKVRKLKKLAGLDRRNVHKFSKYLIFKKKTTYTVYKNCLVTYNLTFLFLHFSTQTLNGVGVNVFGHEDFTPFASTLAAK